MLVPSLSWQNDRLMYINWSKGGVFRRRAGRGSGNRRRRAVRNSGCSKGRWDDWATWWEGEGGAGGGWAEWAERCQMFRREKQRLPGGLVRAIT